MSQEKVVILGGGVSGLAAGHFLARTGRYEVTVLEAAPAIGGLCASFEHEDFTLDYGAHKIYSVIPGVLDEIRDLMGERLLTLPKKNRIFLEGHLVDYPLRMGNLARALGPARFLQLGLGYAISLLKGLFERRPPQSYEEFMIRRFGAPAYHLVFEPLADKVWGDPARLHPEMGRIRVPSANGLEVALKMLGLRRESAETNAEFFYYPRAGFGDWPQALRESIEHHRGRVLTGVRIEALEREGERVTAVRARVDGSEQRFPCDLLVSSIPLPALGTYLFGESDPEFNRAVTGLQFRHLILVYLFINRPRVLEDQWIFFPERKYLFSRIFEQKQMNPALGPAGRTALCCDFTCPPDGWQWTAPDDELAARCVDGLVDAGFLRREEVGGFLVKRVPNFYPRYDQEYAEKMATVSRKLRQVSNLLLTGRLGMYNYNNSDHCADMGRFIAERLEAGEQPGQVWTALERRVADYRIVD